MLKKNLDAESVHELINDYYTLEDAIIEFAIHKYITKEMKGRFYLTNLHFSFYEVPCVMISVKDSLDAEYINEKNFPLSEFIDYYNKGIGSQE